MDNAQKIWDKLRSAGLTPAGATGLMGNLQAESGLNPCNLQNSFEKKLGMSDADYTAAVDCGAYADFVTDGAGYGLPQWTNHKRKAGLLAHAKARGRSIGDLDVQIGYLLQELQTMFKPLWDKLRTTASVREASDAVLLDFERPASVNDPVTRQKTMDRRAAIAQDIYGKFAGGADMEIVMTSAQLCARAEDIADNYKTSYMLGPWGWPANDKMITRATTQGSNAKTNRQWRPQANAIKDKGFLFDCVGLIKGILWGWCGDLSRPYGGAGYACNGVPDCDAKKMIDCCRDVSTDFSTIVPAEAVWMDGHIGIYVGDGMVVEATPKWQGGVQCSTCANVCAKLVPGTAGSRTWTKHGKLPWVDYAAQENKIEEDEEMPKYATLKDVPESYRPTIRKLMEKGALRGEKDPDPNSLEDNVLNLPETYCRVMTTLDRLGVLG